MVELIFYHNYFFL